MSDGFNQEDVMVNTILPDSILEPPENKLEMQDHMKFSWKRCKQLNMVIGNKIVPTTDGNSLFTGEKTSS